MKKYKVDKVKYKSDDDKYRSYNEDTDFECLCGRKCLIVTLFVIVSLIGYLIYLESAEESLCLGEKCKLKSCKSMKSNLCSGTLCMDLCIYNTIDLDSCMVSTRDQMSKYRFFSVSEPAETTILCSSQDIDANIENLSKYYNKPEENISNIDFEEMIIQKISEKLDYEPQVSELVEYLIDLADVNRDEKLNLAEAKTLWSLLNNKHTFYMLMLHKRHYVPRILRFCGDIVEIEPITSTYLYSIEDDSILPSLFPNSYKWSWPKWEYRVKLVLSILEFYLESESFNLNDEFGKNSLYLCSPIESSFGYTYTYDAKLLNYENLLTASELEEKLSSRYCLFDSDCTYTPTCIAKCNKLINRCSSYLAEPQIVNLCKFIKFYLLDDNHDTNITNLDSRFDGILKRCFKLSNISVADSIFSAVFSKAKSTYWSNAISDNTITLNRYLNLTYSLEYSLITNDLRALLWSFIRYTKDPVKPKRTSQTTTTAGPTTVAPKR